MSTINPLSREVSAKIVYVGPGLSGKTTSLQHIHARLSSDKRGALVSLATEEDRTLYFDFLPIRVPKVNGLGVRLHLYTVPGQVFYAATRKLVLNGADGVVFVADAQRARRDANIESLTNAELYLEEGGMDLSRFPLVFQYNKQDLSDLLTQKELHADLNRRGSPEFLSTATTGTGVLEALREIVRRVVTSLNGTTARAPTKRSRSSHPDFARPRSGDPENRISFTPDEGGFLSAKPASHSLTENPQGPSSLQGLDVLLKDGAPSSRSHERDDDAVELGVEHSPDDGQAEVTTERPVAGVSFGALWDSSQRDPIALIESCISSQRYHDAVHHTADALAHLLKYLPLPSDMSTATKASLLGLNGREYLHLCALASQPRESTSHKDALFALYLLVAARVKITHL